MVNRQCYLKYWFTIDHSRKLTTITERRRADSDAREAQSRYQSWIQKNQKLIGNFVCTSSQRNNRFVALSFTFSHAMVKYSIERSFFSTGISNCIRSFC